MYRKLMLAVTLAMLAAMMMASVALGQARPPSGADGGYNCADFDFQEDAQVFYDADPSDPDGLDGPPGEAFSGEQGVACEELPSRGDAGDDTAAPVADDEATVSCEDFTALASGEFSQYQAQQFYDSVATPEQQAILDPDGNGFACDGGTIEYGVDPAEASESTEAHAATPSAPSSTEVAPSAAELPDTGGPALLIAAGAALLGAGWLLRYRG